MDNIRIRTHKELAEISERYYGFSVRQWISIILIALINVPLYFKLSPILGDDIVSWIIIIIAIPIGFFGFFNYQGMSTVFYIPFAKRQYIDFYKPLEYKTEKERLAELEAKKTNKKKKTSPEKKLTPAEKKQLKIEKQQQMKMEKQQKKLLKKQQKIKQQELQKERQLQKELARAKRKYGDPLIMEEYQKSKETNEYMQMQKGEERTDGEKTETHEGTKETT